MGQSFHEKSYGIGGEQFLLRLALLKVFVFGECFDLTMVFPFVFMIGRGGSGRGRGRGMGRGKGAAPHVGITFDRDGEHAKQILRGYLANDPNYSTWDAFKNAHSTTWIISKNNPTGFYINDNMRRNYHAVLKRYNDHIDPNNPFDGQSVFHVVLQAWLS